MEGWLTAEERRLEESRARTAHWKRWGPYLAERAWGTVREDYSPTGTHGTISPTTTRGRAPIAGTRTAWRASATATSVCFALALWNGRDPILKERLFGLTGNEGNHGEDVKEYYYYLDNTPTHSYMKCLYKYPQRAFPYERLVEENRRRDAGRPGVRADRHRRLRRRIATSTSIVEYAKAAPEDMLIRDQRARIAGPRRRRSHVLPTLWFRNTWSWGRTADAARSCAACRSRRPSVHSTSPIRRALAVCATAARELLFTENETNAARLYGTRRRPRCVKDGDQRLRGRRRPRRGESGRARHEGRARTTCSTGGRRIGVIELRLTDDAQCAPARSARFRRRLRRSGSARRTSSTPVMPARSVGRCAAGDAPGARRTAVVEAVLSLRRRATGSTAIPAAAAAGRTALRAQHDWTHLYNADVISMPDKWEYPVVRGVGLGVPLRAAGARRSRVRQGAAHAVAARVVHASQRAAARVRVGVRRREPAGARVGGVARLQDRAEAARGAATVRSSSACSTSCCSISPGGSTARTPRATTCSRAASSGLDNIGVFDRIEPLPTGGHLEQSDGTSWMAMYCAQHAGDGARARATEIRAYEDVASKFWEHFLYIAQRDEQRCGGECPAVGRGGRLLLRRAAPPDGQRLPLRVRSMVGLIPLFAVETLEPELLDRLPGFKRRLEWFIDNRPDLTRNVASMRAPGRGERRLLSIVDRQQLRRVLQVMLDRERVPLAIRHPRPVAVPPATIRTCCRSTARSIAWTTSRRNPRRACSAAIRTGAGRSGFR